ncbi:MAG: DNA polymerase III subunit [Clostridia bacterium]|nr:DNA polymerase III subunit [Clostridia bacterium]
MAAAETQVTTAVIGNRALMERLDRDIRAGQLSHAYILDGRVGSGRHTVARHICAAIACQNRPGQVLSHVEDADQMGFFDLDEPPPPREIPEDAPLPCWECPACRKVLEGKCPDIHLIGRDGKASIGVEAIRFLRQDVLIPPNDLDTKIYIIEDADTMTVQAQNALLLTLEEPPPYVLFLLLCDEADALLETIRSRAPVLRTQPIPDADIRAFLKEQRCTLPEEDLSAVLLRADGCIGQALTLADSRSVKPIMKLRALCDEFVSACAMRRYDRLPAVLNGFGSKRDGVSEVIALITLAVRDLVLLRHGETVKLKYYTDRDAAEELAGRFTTRALLRTYHALGRAADSLEGNGNVRLTLMQLAVDITP